MLFVSLNVIGFFVLIFISGLVIAFFFNFVDFKECSGSRKVRVFYDYDVVNSSELLFLVDEVSNVGIRRRLYYILIYFLVL